MASLFVVATPIGNLEDITLRALRVLGEARLLLAEDTRRTRVLLDRHQISASPVSLHAHNEVARISRALEVLELGEDVAIVSDAGTPLVSDPGERLVEATLAAGYDVVPIPGASAVLAAVMASGLPAERFTFVGFLPRKRGERSALLASYVDRPETLVFFESPRRVAATLEALCDSLGERPACLARELTKLHEEFSRGTLRELAEKFIDGTRGEVTLVVAGAAASPREYSDAEIDARIRAEGAAARLESSKDLASRLAAEMGVPRRRVYARIIALQRDGD